MQSLLIILGLCCAAMQAVAATPLAPAPPVSDHTARWNWFVDALYALHQERIQGREIKTNSSIGGYFREKKFYREVKYFDAANGRHLSTLQWEREHPERIHSIEVYLYDRKGRVVRDYSALFLTFSRSAPQHTLINLHAYHGKLHAFRQFDATDNRIYESCEGSYKGTKVEIKFDEFDLIHLEGQKQTVLQSDVYRACFKGLPDKSVGRFLTPQ